MMKVKTLFAAAIICLATSVGFAQSPAGKWTGEMQGRGGAQPVTLDLTVKGTTLTGTITLGQGQPVEITEGKVEGNKITFKAAGGGGGGRGGGGAGAGGPAGAPPAGAPPAGAGGGAPGGGAPGAGGGGGGRGGRGGGGATFMYTGTINGSEMSVTRAVDAPAGAPAAGGGPGGGAGGGAAQPQTFTLKKS
jgi:hypothetical protein